MLPHFAGAPDGMKPDPRYRIPYDTPIAAAYPAAVVSPGAPKPESWQLEQPKRKTVSPAPANNRPSSENFFQSRDRNGDAAITLKEFIGDPKGRNIPALTKRFKKLDANADGKLNRNEMN